MRFVSLLSAAALLLSSTALARPDVEVSIKFPDKNPFGRVTNGASSNLLHVRLVNHAGEEITVTSIRGQYKEVGGRERPLRNTTTVPLRQPVLPGLASPIIPYKFHSENKIGEVGLRVWVDYLDAGRKPHTLLGYDGAVTVVEPEGSWLDLELLGLYAILLSLASFATYQLYNSYLAPSKKSSKRAKKAVPAVRVVAATPEAEAGAKTEAYEQDWIPAAHLKARKTGGGRKGNASATSGEESEGGKGKKGRK